MSIALNWTEGKPTGESIHCVGCRRHFVGWSAFEAHGERGRCADTAEQLGRLQLVQVGRVAAKYGKAGYETVWKLKEGQ